MGFIFSKLYKNKVKRVTEIDMSILKLKTQRDKLDLQFKRIEKQVSEDDESIRSCIRTKNYEKAKLILCLKKLHNKNLDEISSQIFQIQQLLLNVETAQTHAEVLKSLERGNKALSRIQENQSVEFVQKLVDDFYELNAYVKDVESLLNTNGINCDDEEVLKEFDVLLDLQKLEEAKGTMERQEKVAILKNEENLKNTENKEETETVLTEALDETLLKGSPQRIPIPA